MKAPPAIGLFLAMLPLFSVDAAPSGQALVQQGNGQGATACIACHGADGAGNAAAGYPRLSILTAEYLAQQLRAFQSGQRSNPIMQPIAQALSAEEIDAVAQYYAGQRAEVEVPAAGNADTQQQGEQLAQKGAWEQTIPACVSCHGPGGNGVGNAFPALAGQHASYIEAQIQAWKNGQRRGDHNQLMESVAKRLSDDQAKAVARYFSSLKPGQSQ